MQPTRLDRFFPITYPNGATVSRFAKHCPHCRQLVKASAMQGLAAMLQDKVFVLADAHCPQCQHRFVVKCVIDDSKQVFPVQLPVFLYKMMLQWGIRRQVRLFKQHPDWQRAQQQVEAMMARRDADEAAGETSPQQVDRQSATVSEDIVGRFQGQPIHASIQYQGRTLVYDRAIPQGGLLRLAPDEVLFEQRLVYKPA